MVGDCNSYLPRRKVKCILSTLKEFFSETEGTGKVATTVPLGGGCLRRGSLPRGEVKELINLFYCPLGGCSWLIKKFLDKGPTQFTFLLGIFNSMLNCLS